MSTSRTGSAQLARLFDLGLSVKLLPPLRDVDRPADAELVATEFPGLIFSRRHAEQTSAWPCQPGDRLFDAAYAGMTAVSKATQAGDDQEPRAARRPYTVVLRTEFATSPPVAWSRIGTPSLVRAARALDLLLVEEWTSGGRAIVALPSMREARL